jgi:predicted MPP superfamily phosphohydrolase
MRNLKSKRNWDKKLALQSKAARFLAGHRGTFLTAAGGALLSGAALYLYASRVEARNYKLERVRLTTSKGVKLRILHLSDLHLSAPESHKIEFLERITDEDYDLVVFTGDIFENYSGTQYAKHLIARRPRLGAYAVLGNHDYYAYTWFHKTVGRFNRSYRHPKHKRDVMPMISALQDSGITVMRNSSKLFASERVCLVGIDYPGITPEELGALTAQAPSDWLVLSLLHLPRRLHQLPQAGVDIAFAGHTHGGQIRLPGLGALITDSELPRREASGLVQRDNTVIHVSRGLGADPKTNFRLFCPPHATVIEIE